MTLRTADKRARRSGALGPPATVPLGVLTIKKGRSRAPGECDANLTGLMVATAIESTPVRSAMTGISLVWNNLSRLWLIIQLN